MSTTSLFLRRCSESKKDLLEARDVVPDSTKWGRVSVVCESVDRITSTLATLIGC